MYNVKNRTKAGIRRSVAGFWNVLLLAFVLGTALRPQRAAAGSAGAFFDLILLVPQAVQQYQELAKMFEQVYLAPANNTGTGGSGQGNFEIWKDDAGFYVTTNHATDGIALTVAGFDNGIVTNNHHEATIPDGVGGILSSNLPVTVIFNRAFAGNQSSTWGPSRIASLKIGRLIRHIGDHALETPVLTNITVDAQNISFSSRDGVLFDDNQTALLRYPQGRVGSYTVPDSVTKIADYAFSGCTGLTSVVIGTNVLRIGVNAFASNSVATVYFLGDAPQHNGTAFLGSAPVIYHLGNARGWETNYSGITPTLYAPFICITQNLALTVTGLAAGGWAYPSPTVVIPPRLYGLPVTGVAANAFANQAGFPEVILPNTLTNLGSGAFANCAGLQTLIVPSGVTIIPDNLLNGCANLFHLVIGTNTVSIGNNAMLDCARLSTMRIPATVTQIGNQAFAGCKRVIFDVSPANPKFSSDWANALYNKAQTTLIQFSGNYSGDYWLPETVVAIGDRAFYNNDQLTGIELPAGVAMIGVAAFSGCSTLTNLYFHGDAPGHDSGSFVPVGQGAFAYYVPGRAGWSSLYGGVPTRPWIQFSYETNANNTLTLTQYRGASGSVMLPAVVNGLPLKTIAPGAFAGLRSLTSITIPNSVTNIGDGAFSGCSALTNVNLGNGIITIGTNAFASCPVLAQIVIPNSVVILGSGAFQHSGLTNVIFGTGLTNIADRLFYNCGLSELTLPATISQIGEESFAENYLLRSVIVPGSVSSLAAGAFRECRSLAAVYFQGNAPVSEGSVFNGSGIWAAGGTTIRYLPRTAGWGSSFATMPATLLPLSFATNNGLITITRYEGGGHVPIFSGINGLPVTALADGAFLNCTQLTSVHIPASIGTIGVNAFENCTSLTNLIVDAANPNYATVNHVLFNKARTTLLQFAGGRGGTFFVPDSVATIGPAAFAGSKITSVYIPANVTSIGLHAFKHCGSLTNLTVAVANPNYASVNHVLFNKAQTVLLQFAGGLDGSYTIPGSVTNVGAAAFVGSKLASVVIPAGVTGIVPGALASCRSLTNITVLPGNLNYSSAGGLLWNPAQTTILQFPGGRAGSYAPATNVTAIGAEAFAGCALDTVTLHANLTAIGARAFADAPQLINVNCFGNARPDDGTAFLGSRRAKVYHLPDTTGWGATFGSAPTELIPFAVQLNAGQSLTITSSLGTNSTVLVPGVIFDTPVTAIGPNAFFNRGDLIQVILPPSVTRIGTNAFTRCIRLVSVNLHSLPSVVLEDGAFAECDSLRTVNMPAGPSRVGQYAFYLCLSLRDFNFGGTTNIGAYAFKGCTWLTFLSLGRNVSSVGAYAFEDCRYLGQVTVPASVASIGTRAFANCGTAALKVHVFFLGNAPANDGTAFVDSFADIIYQPNTTGWGATYGGAPAEQLPFFFQFDYFAGRATVTGVSFYLNSTLVIPNSTEAYSANPVPVTAIGTNAFAGNLAITNVIIPEGITNIAAGAFANCSNLVNVALPTSLISIGGGAFANCPLLTGLILPDTLTAIGSNAFANCTSLTNLSFGAALGQLGSGAFVGCVNLRAIRFLGDAPTHDSTVFAGATLATIYALPGRTGWGGAFAGVPTTAWIQFTATTNEDNTISLYAYNGPGGAVTVPGTVAGLPVTRLGDNVFAGRYELHSVTLPDNLTQIGSYAFKGCASLTNVVFGTNLATVQSGAFEGCRELKHLTLPRSLTVIGDQAFAYSGLTSVSLPDTLTSIGRMSFYSCPITQVFLPNLIADIGNEAFMFCALTNIVLPPNLTFIGDRAFKHCPLEGGVNLPPLVTFIGNAAFEGPTQYFCEGNAPATSGTPFGNAIIWEWINGVRYRNNIGPGIVYRQQSAAGWGSTYSGLATAEWSPFRYAITNGTALISGYAGSGGNLALPGSIGNLPVIGIAANAFATNASLTRVTIPASVAGIGSNAFAFCTNLAAVVFTGNAPAASGAIFSGSPTTVHYMIGTAGWGGLFGGAITQGYNPSGHLTVTIDPHVPGAQWRVDGGAWRASGTVATNLIEGAHTVSFSTVGGTWETPYIFTADVIRNVTRSFSRSYQFVPFTYTTNVNLTLTITGYIGADGVVSIPSAINGGGVSGIAAGAFSNATHVTSVIMPNSITNLGTGAFAGCTNLTSVAVSSGIGHVPALAFANCPQLQSVLFNGNAPTVDATAFSGSPGAVIYYVGGTSGWGGSFGSQPAALVPFNFAVSGNEVAITGYTGAGGDVRIPDTIGGLPVTFISAESFASNASVTSVVIPNGVRGIDYQAFKDCSNLVSVAFNPNLQWIGVMAFRNCASLTNVVIPDSTYAIYNSAFTGNRQLRSVVIGSGVTNLEAGVFESCSNLTSLTMGANVTAIGAQAFLDCFSLTNFIFPTRLASVGGGAFANCSNLTAVTFHRAVSIGSSAFSGCSGLTGLVLPAGSWLSGGSFLGCFNLQSVFFRGEVQADFGTVRPFPGCTNAIVYYRTPLNWWQEIVPGQSYDYQTAIGYTVKPDNTVRVDRFVGNSSHPTVPASIEGLPVTEVGDDAFGASAYWLVAEQLSIGANIVKLGRLNNPQSPKFYVNQIVVDAANTSYSSLGGVMFDKTRTTLIHYPIIAGNPNAIYTVPATVTRIGDLAFLNVWMERINLSSNIVSIGCGAFSGMNFLNTVFNPNPNALLTLGTNAFAGCVSLTSATFGNQLAELPASTFSGCTALASVNLGGGLTRIGDAAFLNCSQLKRVTLPAPVHTIGVNAFSGCSALTNVVFPANLSSIGTGAFANCGGLTTLYLPPGPTVNGRTRLDLGAAAFTNCANLTSAYFQGDAPLPDNGAFVGDALATVYYLASTSGWQATFGGVPTAVYGAFGSLKVTANYGAAQWRVDGGPWQASGGTVSNLSAGPHTVSFSLWPNSLTPPDQLVVITNLSLTTASAVYAPAPINYTVNPDSSTVTVVGGTVPDGILHIPATINGLTVVNIAANAFSGRSDLKCVVIPHTVTNISDNAFFHNVNLVTVLLGTNVSHIGSAAFNRCGKLGTIRLPDSLVSLGSYAFNYCTNLSGVIFGNGMSFVGSDAFLDAPNLASFYFNGAAPGDLTFLKGWYPSLTAYYFHPGQSGWTAGTNNGVTRASWLGLFNHQTNAPGDITLTKYSEDGVDFRHEVMVPDFIAGRRVTAIGAMAFSKARVRYVDIPATVTRLGDYAFFDGIWRHPFVFAGMTHVGEGAFARNYTCESIMVDPTNPNYSSVGGMLFNKDRTVLLQCPVQYGGNEAEDLHYTVPDSVTTIAVRAFDTCFTFASISIPAGMTNISAHAFSYCSSLTNITVSPGNPVFIAQNGALVHQARGALLKCFGSEDVIYKVAKEIKSIEGGAFKGMWMPGVVIPYGVTNIGAEAFMFCRGLTNIALPYTVSDIGADAFRDCRALNVAQLPMALENIPDGLFRDCTSLVQAEIPATVTHIGRGAFANTLLGSVQLPAGLVRLGAEAFQSCTFINNPIVIPNGVTSIEDYTFRNCYSLPEVIIGAGVTNIGVGAFSGNMSLHFPAFLGMNFPAGVIWIGAEAFANCSLAGEINFGSNLVSIGDRAFYNCLFLDTVRFRAGLTHVGFEAFAENMQLYKADFLGNAPADNGSSFGNSPAATVYYHSGTTGWGATFGSAPTVLVSDGNTVPDSPANRFVTNDSGNDGNDGNNDGPVILGGPPEPANGITILSYKGPSGNVGIPSQINGKPVIGIGPGAFDPAADVNGGVMNNNFTLASLQIPATVTDIAPDAFANSGVTNFIVDAGNPAFVSVAGSLYTADQSTLVAPANQPTLNLPASVVSVNGPSFNGCSALTNITVAAANPFLRGVQGVLFTLDQTTLLRVPPGFGGLVYEVPSGVSDIGESAFAQCGFHAIRFPASVITIGSRVCAESGLASSVSSKALYFDGDAPMGADDPTLFNNIADAKVIHLPNTGGWDVTFGNAPTASWLGLFNWSTNVAGGITLTSYQLPVNDTYVLFPANITGRAVTDVGTVFASNYISGITLPNTVHQLVDYAFHNSGPSFFSPHDFVVKLPTALTNIGDWAFAGCRISEMSLPGSVTTIGDHAFSDMGLRKLTLPGKLAQIGDYAFANGGLERLVIPASVSHIGNSAFANNQIAFLTMRRRATNFTATLGTAAFASNRITRVVVPVQYSSIGAAAFANNLLTEAEVPAGINDLRDAVFADNELANFNFPPGLTNIGSFAFANNRLTTANIPSGVKRIGASAFANNELDDVNLPPQLTVLEDSVLADNYLTDFVVPNGITTIGNYAFDGCLLFSLDLPSSLVSIGASAFRDGMLTTVVIPASVTNVGPSAFEGNYFHAAYFLGNAPGNDNGTAFANNLSDTIAYYLPGRTGWAATYGSVPTALLPGTPLYFTNADQSLTVTGFIGSGDIVIPDQINGLAVTAIASGAFTESSPITSVTIPATVTTIDLAAFINCPTLTDIIVDGENPVFSSIDGVLFNRTATVLILCPPGRVGHYAVPNSVTAIGEGAFFGCDQLTDITLPNNLTSIDDMAFAFCDGLTTMIIPAGVAHIGYYAFAYCSGLTAVYFEGDAPTDDGDVFYGTDEVIVYYRADAVNWSYSFGGAPSLGLNGPVTAPVTVYRLIDEPLRIPIATLPAQAGWSDLGGFNPVSFASVNVFSTNFGVASVNGGDILYTNANNVRDLLTYTVANSRGETTQGIIHVVIAPKVTLTLPGGVPTLTVTGVSNDLYQVQASTNLIHWTTVWTTNAPATRVWRFTDPNPPQSGAFYRVSPEQ